MISNLSKFFYNNKVSYNQEAINNYEILDNLVQELDSNINSEYKNNINLEQELDSNVNLEDEIDEKSDIIIKEIVEEIIDKIDRDDKNFNKLNKNLKTTNCLYFTYGIIIALVINKII